jgi:hypothetical protein
MKRYLVIDQNVLRRGALGERLAAEAQTSFVLPDMAFLEMTKSDKWESTLNGSLQSLANYPERIHVSRSVNEALGMELATFRSVEGKMLFAEATTFVRDVLHSVRTGIDGQSIMRIRADPGQHRKLLAKNHFSHEENKIRLKELVDSTKYLLSEEIQKRMRRGKVADSERLQVIHDIAAFLLPKILSERGISNEKARVFMKKKPMVLRYFFSRAWYCVSWIQNGGFEGFPPERVTNDEVDQQYVLSATFFHGLLSFEPKVNDCYKDVLLLLSKRA